MGVVVGLSHGAWWGAVHADTHLRIPQNSAKFNGFRGFAEILGQVGFVEFEFWKLGNGGLI